MKTELLSPKLFKDPTRITKFLRILLYCGMLVSVLDAVHSAFEWQFFHDIQNGAYTVDAQIDAWGEAGGDARLEAAVAEWVETDNEACLSQEALTAWIEADVEAWSEAKLAERAQPMDIGAIALGIIGVPLGLLEVVILFMWIYRANYNVRCFGARDMRFTPGWAVGWFFVPIFNAWRPYQVMKEIWKTSINVLDWANQPVSRVLIWWWVLSFFCSSFDKGAMKMYWRAEKASEYMTADIMSIAADGVSLVTSCLLLVIIRKIYNAQMAQYRALQVIDPLAQGENKAMQIEG